jgi:hypothetical protein
MVRVIVGEGESQRNFTIHKALLVQASIYFERCLNGNFKEATQAQICLTHHHPVTFEFVYQWLYTGVPPDPCDVSNRIATLEEQQRSVTIQHFWLCVLQLVYETMIDELKEHAYRRFVTELESRMPKNSVVEFVFGPDFPVPNLRDFLVEVAAYQMVQSIYGRSPRWSSGAWSRSWEGQPEYKSLVMERVAAFTEKDTPLSWTNPCYRKEFTWSVDFDSMNIVDDSACQLPASKRTKLTARH